MRELQVAQRAINGALTGTIPGAGFAINQTFLTLTAVYLLIPSLMVIMTLVLPARINRTTNNIVSLAYAETVVVNMSANPGSNTCATASSTLFFNAAVSALARPMSRGSGLHY